MNILFVAQAALKKELGGPKVVLELAEAMSALGHNTTVVGPEEINIYLNKNLLPVRKEYAVNINVYVNKVIDNYDVVDIDANHLYKFIYTGKKKILVVARSVLFIPHLAHINYPQPASLKQRLKSTIKNILYVKQSFYIRNKRFYKSLNAANLINVSNHRDVDQMVKDGFTRDKILNIPYGLIADKRQNLLKIAGVPKSKNGVVFLGTFDYRKGCLDTVKIFDSIKRRIPNATLTLLGTKGLFQTEDEIYSFFPKSLRSSISIILSFMEQDLPSLLTDFKVAIFPSYLEGFGFSVVESMAAGIPVIAYDSPGPSSILRSEYLVKPGNWECMADKVVSYLKDENKRQAAGQSMIQDSKQYDWRPIAAKTIECYSKYYDTLS